MKYVFFFFFILNSFMFSQINKVDSNGFKQGYWELYFPGNDSLISEKGYFLDDKENGLWEKFHDNGIIREILYYKKGLIDGVRIVLDKKGKLQNQENYMNNKFHGKQKYFHDTGKLKLEVNYQHGILEGNFSKYYRSGKKQESSIYLNGLKHGVSLWFFENEIISIEYPYLKGKIHGIVKTYYSDGSLKSESSYVNNELNGEKKEYFPSKKRVCPGWGIYSSLALMIPVELRILRRHLKGVMLRST